MRFSKDIDNLVSKILSEEIKMKHEEKFGKKGQWMEIEMDEELHGKQHKIDVAPPKGKITAADFKKLRNSKTNKKTETEEQWQGALARIAVPMAASYIGSKLAEDDDEITEKREKPRPRPDIVIDDILDGKVKNNVSVTEDELIDMIENIVKEQIVKDVAEENNFSVVKPQGLKKTEKTQSSSKKENDDYAKEVVKKMKDYMKDMYMGGGSYDENPDDFPQSNYQMDKDAKVMKYNPSDAVEEYIEAFAYPGMTNLVYDEIKPDDEKIGKYIKGDSTTGNAIKDKGGKALGNVSKRSEKTGDRFKKNFDENLYGAEQMNVSYKRQSQPVDIAGEKKESGKLSSKKTSTQKAQKIMNQLESMEVKTTKIINEDLAKMRNLITYNRKTQ